MTTREDFLSAWRLRFPVDKPPDLECFRAVKNGSEIKLDTVREEKRKYENKVLALKNELHQHEFIVSFMWEILNGPRSPNHPLIMRKSPTMEAPLESPPPIPTQAPKFASADHSDPDLSLDCQVPVDELPKRAGSHKYISQVPAYLETNLDFAIDADTSVSPDKSGTKPAGQSQTLNPNSSNQIKTDRSNDSGELKHEAKGKLLGLNKSKQNSFDKCSDSGKNSFSVTTPTTGSSIAVSHGTKDVHGLTNLPGHQSPSQAVPVRTESASIHTVPTDRAPLTRNLSENSNVSTFLQHQQRRDQNDNQRRTVNFGSPFGETVDISKKGSPSGSPSGGFSTFKPLAQNSFSEADKKPKPRPAPRPSLGPEVSVGRGRPSIDSSYGGEDLSPVPEHQASRMSTSSHIEHSPTEFPIPRAASLSKAATLPSGSNLQHSESQSSSDIRSRRGPATAKKPSFRQQDFVQFDHKPGSSDTDTKNAGPPVMKVRSQNGSKSMQRSFSEEQPPKDKVFRMPSAQGIPVADPSVPRSSMSGSLRDKTPGVVVPEKIYEEPIPVRVDRIEEASSSSEDDEPVYQNLMLLKHQSLARGQSAARSAMFASMDYQKRHLKKQAERLSRRFSTSIDVSAGTRGVSAADQLRSIGEQDSPGSSVSSAGPEDSPAWRKRRSMLFATGDDTASEDDSLDVMVPTCPETEKLQMRRWVVTSIVASERAYLLILDTLMQYMQTFKNVLSTPQEVITADDIKTIFYKTPELHRVHFDFVKVLEPKLENWTGEEEVAEQFKILALEECPLATDYLKNYQKAVTNIHRCSAENETFAELTKSVKCKGVEETYTLEELVHKPVVRFQRNTLVLHDLIKFTPTSHPDYDTLQKTRKIAQNFLENFESSVSKANAENQRYLSKHGVVVEKASSQRKLRHIFLFNDVFLCAKQKLGRQRVTFEVKWNIPIKDLVIVDARSIVQEERQLSELTKAETDRLHKKVSELQGELKQELKRAKLANDSQRTWSFRSHKGNLEKIRKKLNEQEGILMLAAPHLILKLVHKSNRSDRERSFTLLLASDYERNSWKETIIGLQHKPILPHSTSNVELTNLLNSLKLPKLNSTGSVDVDDFELEDEALFGSLDVTIHKLYGLKGAADVFCCMEVDSFGHFCMKAKTNTVTKTAEPTWNENFEIELDGSQTLRVMCYKMAGDTDTLIGKCALELGKGWLRGDFSEEAISIGEAMTLVVTLKYRNREQTIKRTPSSVQGGLFGVKISSVTHRENTKIPLLVKYCVEEVERRGINDVGIYRISGLTGEVQRLKKAFEKSPVGAAAFMRELDINVVTSLFKLYFRELPESLFTDKLYNRLQEGMTLSDPEAKEKFMMTLLKQLPEPNNSTVTFVLDHLLKVSQNDAQNKMSLHNLATVFGPTLLRPAFKESEPISMEQLFTAGARDAMMQTGILYFYMSNWHNKDNQTTRSPKAAS